MTLNQANELIDLLKQHGWRRAHCYRANNSPHWETYYVAAVDPDTEGWKEFKMPYGPDRQVPGE